MFLKRCRRCDKIFRATGKKCKICPKCHLPRGFFGRMNYVTKVLKQ